MKKVIIAIFALILGGCLNKEIKTTSEKAHITIKTRKLKYSDIGVITKSEDNKYVMVQIFSLGNEILKIEMKNFISVNNGMPIPFCVFNRKHFTDRYRKDVIKRIFLGEKIFDGKGFQKTDDGFIQEFDGIEYRVSKKEIYFYDREGSILIDIKRLNL